MSFFLVISFTDNMYERVHVPLGFLEIDLQLFFLISPF